MSSAGGWRYTLRYGEDGRGSKMLWPRSEHTAPTAPTAPTLRCHSGSTRNSFAANPSGNVVSEPGRRSTQTEYKRQSDGSCCSAQATSSRWSS